MPDSQLILKALLSKRTVIEAEPDEETRSGDKKCFREDIAWRPPV
jgi:hypothetical protein